MNGEEMLVLIEWDVKVTGGKIGLHVDMRLDAQKGKRWTAA